MKTIVSLVIATYMCGLSFWGCADATSFCFPTADSESHSHDSQHDKDLCSPFCICECCQMVLQVAFVTQINFKKDTYPPCDCIVLQEKTKDFKPLVFHPPALV